MSRVKTKSGITAKTLQDLGLSENEAVLYSLMLARPSSTARELTALSPFPRTLLYHVLNQLIRKGLVASKKSAWRTVYIAGDPELLYDLLARKEHEAERTTAAVRELVPHLKRQYRLAGKRPSVRVFEGIAEYEKVLEDCFISGTKEIFAYEHFIGKKPALETRLMHERRRALRKIKKKILFFETEDSLQLLAKRPYDDFTEYRSIAGTLAPFETDVTLYGDKMLYTSYYDPHEPAAILVEDRALYQMQKNLFDALWKSGKDRTLYYTEAR
jgi:sugar-specific transcriptional regulator TrmB